MNSITNSILLDLQHLIEGEVTNTPGILAEFSQDFGRIIQKHPQVVIRPQNSADVVQVVKYALEQGLTISPRAAGHSLSGQSLNQDGIILDMRSLNQIHDIQKDMLWFKADAGVSWRKVVDASLPHGLIPPVLTNYFDVTLGGTHASGGLGASSFRYGTQADNCLGVEVVTGTGDLVWCTPQENSELFHHVLCGYGQFGIITQIQHRLRKYHPFTRTYLLVYDNLDALLTDKHILIAEDRVDYLVSLPSSCLQGISRTGGRIQPLIQWFYTMQISVEASSTTTIDDQKILSGLNFYRHIHTEDLTFEDFIVPIVQVNDSLDIAHPWIDVLLPASVAKNFIETTLNRLPAFLDFSKTPMGCFCLLSRNINLPMFRVPNEELIIGFGIYPTIPKSQLQPVLNELALISDFGLKIGAKRYLTGWLQFEYQQWQIQFEDYWCRVNEMKKKYDPKEIFNPSFFKFEYAAHSI